jgi:hypothetical protein
VCSGACVDVQSDTHHCGTCDVACSPGTRCEKGSCVETCADTECNGACVDLLHDPLNCGSCGAACAPAHSQGLCVDGACAHSDCEPGWIDCDLKASNGCEAPRTSCLIDVCGVTDAGLARTCSLMGLSDDAKRVLFESTSSFVPGDQPMGFVTYNLYVYDVPTGEYSWATRYDPDGGSPSSSLGSAVLSGDGRWVAFVEGAALRFGDPNQFQHTYLYDADTGALSLFQPAFDAGFFFLPGVSKLSFDGRYLLETFSDLGFPVPVWSDLDAGLSVTLPAAPASGMSGDGLILAFEGGNEFRRLDLTTQRTDAVPVPDPPLQFSPSIIAVDATGARVAFELDDFTGSGRIYVMGDGGVLPTLDGGAFYSGGSPALSADGRVLAFSEEVPGVTFRRVCSVVDLQTGRHVQLPYSAGDCLPALSRDGRSLAASFVGESLYVIPLALP